MAFQARSLPIPAISIPLNLSSLCYYLCIRRSHSTTFYLQTSGPTERPNSSQRSISLSLQLDDWQDPFQWLNPLTTLRRIQAPFIHIPSWIVTIAHAFLNWRCYCLCAPYKDIPIIYEIFHVLLPEQHPPGRGGCTRMLCKRTSTGHCMGSWPLCFTSFLARHPTGILILTHQTFLIRISIRISRWNPNLLSSFAIGKTHQSGSA